MFRGIISEVKFRYKCFRYSGEVVQFRKQNFSIISEGNSDSLSGGIVSERKFK